MESDKNTKAGERKTKERKKKINIDVTKESNDAKCEI